MCRGDKLLTTLTLVVSHSRVFWRKNRSLWAKYACRRGSGKRIRLHEIAVWKKSWRLGCLKRQRIHSLLHKKELLLSGKSLTNFITQMVRAFSTLHSDAGFVRCKYLRFRLVRPFYRTAIIQLIYLMCIYFQGTTRPQATCGTFNEDPSGSYFGSPSIFWIAPVVGERKTRVVKRFLKSSPPRCPT